MKVNGSEMFVSLDLLKNDDIFIIENEVKIQVVLKCKGLCSKKGKDDAAPDKKKVALLEKEVCVLKGKVETMEKEKVTIKTKKKRMTGTEKAKRRKQKAKEMAAQADLIISNVQHIEPPLSPIL